MELLDRYDRLHLVLDRGLLRRRPDVCAFLDSCDDARVRKLELAGGERTKNFGTLSRVMRWFDANDLTRRSQAVVAVGGGAILDSVSLAATLYRRGVTFWRVPTTLLGAIDAGIGVKSAVNFYGRKNLVGTYMRPEGVVVDPVTLTSMSQRELRSGLAETAKLGLGADADLFELLEHEGAQMVTTRFQRPPGRELIERSIRIMLDELAADPFEQELTHRTDLGHSFSRTYEEVLRPRLLHGEAVSLDIALTMFMTDTTDATRERVLRCLRQLRLPIVHDGITMDMLATAYDQTVIHRDSTVFPLPTSPGITQMREVTKAEVFSAQAALEAFVTERQIGP